MTHACMYAWKVRATRRRGKLLVLERTCTAPRRSPSLAPSVYWCRCRPAAHSASSSPLTVVVPCATSPAQPTHTVHTTGQPTRTPPRSSPTASPTYPWLASTQCSAAGMVRWLRRRATVLVVHGRRYTRLVRQSQKALAAANRRRHGDQRTPVDESTCPIRHTRPLSSQTTFVGLAHCHRQCDH